MRVIVRIALFTASLVFLGGGLYSAFICSQDWLHWKFAKKSYQETLLAQEKLPVGKLVETSEVSFVETPIGKVSIVLRFPLTSNYMCRGTNCFQTSAVETMFSQFVNKDKTRWAGGEDTKLPVSFSVVLADGTHLQQGGLPGSGKLKADEVKDDRHVDLSHFDSLSISRSEIKGQEYVQVEASFKRFELPYYRKLRVRAKLESDRIKELKILEGEVRVYSLIAQGTLNKGMFPLSIVLLSFAWLAFCGGMANVIGASARSDRRSYCEAVFLSLFLGFAGADRFYLGYRRTAFLKLWSLGGFGLLYLADFFLVLLGIMQDVRKQPLRR